MPHKNTDPKTAPQGSGFPLTLTCFPSRGAFRKKELTLSRADLAAWIVDQRAESKDSLPWIKLATFGPDKTPKKSLRHNANVRTVTGLEADYDAGTMTPETARDALEKAGVAGLVYTTPSHSADAPRWRVLAPFSGPLPPEAREELMARLNGILGGALDPASFTLSQSYYAGNVEGGTQVETFLVNGQPIDMVNGLAPIYKDGGSVKRERRAASGEGLALQHVREALLSIPNDASVPDAAERLWWLHMGMALHHATGGNKDGLALFHEWSERHPSYNPDETAEVWDSFGGGGKDPRTFATIRAEARRHGWHDLIWQAERAAEIDSEFDSYWTPEELVEAETAATIDELVGDPAAIKAKADLDAITAQARLRFLSPSECEGMPARRYVVKGLLAERDVGCIVGAPGAGKSLLAPFLGYGVARGDRVFGHRTRAGGVLYVAAEDAHGMRGRVTALKDTHGDADAFRLVEGVSDLLNSQVAGQPSPHLAALQKAVKARKPALVVIDTIAMAFPGLEENDARSMGLVVRAARSLTKWGAAVLLIHHDTKDGQQGLPRGHSILNGALDMSLHLKRDGGVVTGRLTKNRNGTTDQTLAFTVKTVTLGEDEDGDPVTTAICEESDGPERAAPKLSASVAAALTIFNELPQPVTDEDWRQAVIDARTVSASDDPDSRRKAYKRAVEDLTRKGIVVFSDGKFALAAGDYEDFTDDMVKGVQ